MKALIASLLLLAGCASANYEAARQAYARGDWPTAQRHLEAEVSASPDGQVWYNLAMAYDKQHKRKEALAAMQMSARYGFPQAQATLTRIGQSVPSADLAQKPDATADMLFLQSLQKKRSRDCIAIPVGGMINLDCD